MGENSIPGSFTAITLLHESSRGEGRQGYLVAALVLALGDSVPIRGSVAQGLDEDGHGCNTGCIQSARVSNDVR